MSLCGETTAEGKAVSGGWSYYSAGTGNSGCTCHILGGNPYNFIQPVYENGYRLFGVFLANLGVFGSPEYGCGNISGRVLSCFYPVLSYRKELDSLSSDFVSYFEFYCYRSDCQPKRTNLGEPDHWADIGAGSVRDIFARLERSKEKPHAVACHIYHMPGVISAL